MLATKESKWLDVYEVDYGDLADAFDFDSEPYEIRIEADNNVDIRRVIKYVMFDLDIRLATISIDRDGDSTRGIWMVPVSYSREYARVRSIVSRRLGRLFDRGLIAESSW